MCVNTLQASLVTHYALVVRGDMWRLKMLEDFPNTTLPTIANQSTLSGATYVNYSDNTVKLSGAGHVGNLGSEEYSQVQDMWTVHIKGYDRLRDRFRSEVRRDLSRSEADTMQIPYKWVPRYGDALTDDQKEWTLMTSKVAFHTRAVVNGKFNFRPRHSQLKFKTDDSAVRLNSERQRGRGIERG